MHLVRGLARALKAVSFNGDGRCWCSFRPGDGFHTQPCTEAGAELAAAITAIGDTRHPVAARQVQPATR